MNSDRRLDESPMQSLARKPDRKFIAGLLLLALVSYLPFLSARSLYADDWSWFQIYFSEGGGRILQLMLQAAHPAFGPHLASLFALGDGSAGLLGNLVSVAFHLLNGALLFAILRRPRLTRRIALLATAIFLFEPFYSARASHTMYDEYLTLYLLSIRFMDSPRRALRWLAPLCMLGGMSLETLMCLEPLRLLYAYRGYRGLGDLARRIAPFWSIALAVAVWRFGFVESHGHFSGQKLISLAPLDLLRYVSLTALSFPAGIGFAGWQAADLLSVWGLAGLGLVAVALACRFDARTAPPALLSSAPGAWRQPVALLALALVLLVGAALPHAITGEHAWPTRFETRFGFVAQIGATIGLASLVQLLPWRRLRAAVTLPLLAVLALGSLHDGKWYLFDGYIQRDLQARLRAYVWSDPDPELVRLEIQPASNRTFFRYRCLGANDLNVPLNWLRPAGAEPSFVYETLCGDFDNMAPKRCSTTYLDSHDCPVRRVEAVYRLDPAADQVGKMSLWHLIGLGLDLVPPPPLDHRLSIVTDGVETAATTHAPPPPDCTRPGTTAIATMLRLTACRE